MNIRDLILEIVFIIIMAISGVLIISRLWQDVVIAIGVLILALSFGGLLLMLIIRIRKLEEEQHTRERNMRAYLEDLGRQLVSKQDKTAMTIIETVDSLKSRMYR